MLTRLTDLLTVKRVKVGLEATSKEGVIGELIGLLSANGDLTDAAAAQRAVMEREHTRTTGIGHGLAIPHGKCDAVGQLVMAIGITSRPVDFQSIDGQPVNLVVLLISPMDQTGPHIQALARISRLMSIDQFRRELLNAKDAAGVCQAVAKREQQEIET